MDAQPDQYIACPFCGEPDFDLRGLKAHLERGWCEKYEGIDRLPTLFEVIHGAKEGGS